MLAQDNRWRVGALATTLLLSGSAAVAVSPPKAVGGLAVAVGLDAAATGIFAYISWRHWPARVFALPQGLPAFRRRLHRCAAAMLVLVGSGFLVAVTARLR